MKPIIFSTPMVKAILEGRKTQTRRVIRYQRKGWRYAHLKTDLGFMASIGHLWAGFFIGTQSQSPGYFKCPYGKPGDELWVRETWMPGDPAGNVPYYYRASDPEMGKCFKWHPSIHMPRKAARILLKITDIRVERVQDIDNIGIQAEGTEGLHPLGGLHEQQWRQRFHSLWDSINAKRGYPWEKNPWVWVVEFKRIEE